MIFENMSEHQQLKDNTWVWEIDDIHKVAGQEQYYFTRAIQNVKVDRASHLLFFPKPVSGPRSNWLLCLRRMPPVSCSWHCWWGWFSLWMSSAVSWLWGEWQNVWILHLLFGCKSKSISHIIGYSEVWHFVLYILGLLDFWELWRTFRWHLLWLCLRWI